MSACDRHKKPGKYDKETECVWVRATYNCRKCECRGEMKLCLCVSDLKLPKCHRPIYFAADFSGQIPVSANLLTNVLFSQILVSSDQNYNFSYGMVMVPMDGEGIYTISGNAAFISGDSDTQVVLSINVNGMSISQVADYLSGGQTSYQNTSVSAYPLHPGKLISLSIMASKPGTLIFGSISMVRVSGF